MQRREPQPSTTLRPAAGRIARRRHRARVRGTVRRLARLDGPPPGRRALTRHGRRRRGRREAVLDARCDRRYVAVDGCVAQRARSQATLHIVMPGPLEYVMPLHGRSAADVAAALDASPAMPLREGRTFGLVFHAGTRSGGRRSRTTGTSGTTPSTPTCSRACGDVGDRRFARHGCSPAAPSARATAVHRRARRLPDQRRHRVDPDGGQDRQGPRRPRSRTSTTGNVVLPTSAHAAFSKGCEYFGLEERRVDVDADWRADVDAMADACDDDTVLVVASAPQYPQGVIDPVADVAAIAVERGTNCHVDACMGGFTLPFMETAGLLDAARLPWDFRVPGVTTISADIHKYGYVPKGISVIVHRDKASRRRQTFVDRRLARRALRIVRHPRHQAGRTDRRRLGRAAAPRRRRLRREGRLAVVRARERMEAGVRAIDGPAVLGRAGGDAARHRARPAAAVPSTRSPSAPSLGARAGTSTARVRPTRSTPPSRRSRARRLQGDRGVPRRAASVVDQVGAAQRRRPRAPTTPRRSRGSGLSPGCGRRPG